MGQRLNIEIVNGDTSLANCYYHWSAYSSSALYLTSEIINAYYNYDMPVNVATAVRLFEMTGAGVNITERTRIEKCAEQFGHITFKNCNSRNDGLIAVTEEGKNETRHWEEGRVIIDLASETFYFGVAMADTPEDYEEYLDEDDEFDYDSLDVCEYDLDTVSFADVDNLMEYIESHPGPLRNKSGNVVIYWIS